MMGDARLAVDSNKEAFIRRQERFSSSFASASSASASASAPAPRKGCMKRGGGTGSATDDVVAVGHDSYELSYGSLGTTGTGGTGTTGSGTVSTMSRDDGRAAAIRSRSRERARELHDLAVAQEMVEEGGFLTGGGGGRTRGAGGGAGGGVPSRRRGSITTKSNRAKADARAACHAARVRSKSRERDSMMMAASAAVLTRREEGEMALELRRQLDAQQRGQRRGISDRRRGSDAGNSVGSVTSRGSGPSSGRQLGRRRSSLPGRRSSLPGMESANNSLGSIGYDHVAAVARRSSINNRAAADPPGRRRSSLLSVSSDHSYSNVAYADKPTAVPVVIRADGDDLEDTTSRSRPTRSGRRRSAPSEGIAKLAAKAKAELNAEQEDVGRKTRRRRSSSSEGITKLAAKAEAELNAEQDAGRYDVRPVAAAEPSSKQARVRTRSKSRERSYDHLNALAQAELQMEEAKGGRSNERKPERRRRSLSRENIPVEEIDIHVGTELVAERRTHERGQTSGSARRSRSRSADRMAALADQAGVELSVEQFQKDKEMRSSASGRRRGRRRSSHSQERAMEISMQADAEMTKDRPRRRSQSLDRKYDVAVNPGLEVPATKERRRRSRSKERAYDISAIADAELAVERNRKDGGRVRSRSVDRTSDLEKLVGVTPNRRDQWLETHPKTRGRHGRTADVEKNSNEKPRRRSRSVDRTDEIAGLVDDDFARKVGGATILRAGKGGNAGAYFTDPFYQIDKKTDKKGMKKLTNMFKK